eukprot:CAMPEP_0176419932 /NCGR_PEP_ID=MMETSP0127-20121128/8328_1 /TAXON_ID=938130 /ORGANISM="Platyophrya macrostoma, Strain WH" /LENGTH=177 /DNA_ID=CAMNT_0017800477 /DNA_START=39 /DNA_END=572 /DNA_ORIENTATION=+
MEALNQHQKTLTKLLRRTDEAHSPMHQFIRNAEEKRSILFPERKKIPGRKPKAVLVAALVCSIFGASKMGEIKAFRNRQDLELRKVQRKSAPFLQAISDLQFIAAEERQDMIVKELFDIQSDEEYKKFRQRFHQTDIWVPFKPRYGFANFRTFKNVREKYTHVWYNRYTHGFDVYSI